MTLSADLAQLSFVEESTFGTTPANPVFSVVPFSGESLLYTPRTVTSANITGNRQIVDSALVGATVSGNISADLAYETSLQELIAAALGGSWSANVLKVGTTRRSFTFERRLEAGVTDQYQRFKGCVINGLSLDVSTGGVATVDFPIIGADLVTDTAIISGATYTAISGNPVFVAPQVANISIGGVSQSAKVIGKLGLSLSAGARGIEGLGTLGLRDVNLGTLDVTLTYDVYFADAMELTLLKAQTATDITFTLTDSAGKDLIFALGTVKVSDVRVAAGGKNTDIMATVTMTGLYDTSDASSIVITRMPT
jgi:hypothetical protein